MMSCEQDIVFPDPGFELEDRAVEVRRDTADYYDINLRMNVPNKVAQIEILDARQYESIETISEYNGQSKFDFNYRIDLRSFEKDTTLAYIIKITDQDTRTFNSGFKIRVRPFSFPTLRLVGGENIAVAAPAYFLRGIITTGLNAVSSVQIYFKGEEQYAFEANPDDEPIREMPLKQLVFLGNLEEGQEYDLDIVIEDDKGQVSTTTVKVRKSSIIKRPRKINFVQHNGTEVEINLTYNEAGDVTKMDYLYANGQNYYHEFSYNDLGQIDTLMYRSGIVGSFFHREDFRYFSYVEGTNQIATIGRQIFDYEYGELASSGGVTTDVQDVVYDGVTSKMVSYRRGSTFVDNIRYEDPFNLGEHIFAEYWQDDGYIGSAVRRQHRSEYDPVISPLFTEKFPPFIFTTDVVLAVFNDLFWTKYVPIKTVPTSTSYNGTYLHKPTYTYETDNEGNIVKLIKLYNGGSSFGGYPGSTAVYNFIY
ncbi:hypothetical protein GCM10023163_09730 [Aestuariibaculum suncheonense]